MLELPLGSLCAFLLVLARVAGMMTSLPIPAFRAAPSAARAILAVAMTIALFPAWPILPNKLPAMGQLTVGALAEFSVGTLLGLAVSFLIDGMQMGMQMIGLQAGYGYASMVDPSSEADSGILQVMMLLFAGLLFFSLGFDRQVIRVLAASLERYPAGEWTPTALSMDSIVRLAGTILTTGLRLALPVTALLLLIDIALALLGRMQQQLQLIQLAFPAKMLATLALLAGISPLIPRIFAAAAEKILESLWRILAI